MRTLEGGGEKLVSISSVPPAPGAAQLKLRNQHARGFLAFTPSQGCRRLSGPHSRAQAEARFSRYPVHPATFASEGVGIGGAELGLTSSRAWRSPKHLSVKAKIFPLQKSSNQQRFNQARQRLTGEAFFVRQDSSVP